MAENDDAPKAEFTDEGKLVVAITKSLFAGDVDDVFRNLQNHMKSNDLKVSESVISDFETLDLVEGKAPLNSS